METYNETILRFRVVRCRVETPERLAILRLHDIAPEDGITRELVWSFKDRDVAEACAREEGEFGAKYGIWFEVIDNGEASVVERAVMF